MDLKKLREEIDQLDEKLIEVLARRDGVVGRISAAKAAHHMPVLYPRRENELFERIRQLSRLKDIDETYTKKLFHLILQHSRELQNTII